MKLQKLFALVASLLSVIISCSIIIEFNEYLDLGALILVSGIMLFVIGYNEHIKVRELRNMFNKDKYSITLVIITFTASFLLSGFGIYFWTNKTQETESKNEIVLAEKKQQIQHFYDVKIDSISNLVLNTESYNSILEKIDFWKDRNCSNDEQRKNARQSIIQWENRLIKLEDQFAKQKEQKIKNLHKQAQTEIDTANIKYDEQVIKVNKNKYLFWILFGCMFAIEFMIVAIQYNDASCLTSDQRKNLIILKSLLIRDYDHIKLKAIHWHPLFNPSRQDNDASWNRAKGFKYLIGDLGIIVNDKELIKRDPDKDGFITEKEKAVQILEHHYQVINGKV